MPKKKVEYLTTEDIKYITEQFFKLLKKEGYVGKKKFDVKLDVILNFMSEIKADMMVTKRMLFFLTKHKLTREELQEFARISKTIEKESGKN